MKKTILIIYMSFFLKSIFSQDIEIKANHHSNKYNHRITLGLGHTHVSEGKVEGRTEWLVLPSWSLNYDYWISEKLAIGLQNDLILESFIIESHEKELIQRKYPLAMVPVIMYKFTNNISVSGGVGAEFSKGHNLAMTRIGLEYGKHLPKNWEIGIAMVYDFKWNYYNSWGIAFTVSKIKPKRQKNTN